MSQSARRPRLALESFDKFQLLHKLRRDNLYGNGALRADVRGEINRSHPALTEFPFYSVFVIKRLPDDVSANHIRSFTFKIEISLKKNFYYRRFSQTS
jgi:hypothetical protein